MLCEQCLRVARPHDPQICWGCHQVWTQYEFCEECANHLNWCQYCSLHRCPQSMQSSDAWLQARRRLLEANKRRLGSDWQRIVEFGVPGQSWVKAVRSHNNLCGRVKKEKARLHNPNPVSDPVFELCRNLIGTVVIMTVGNHEGDATGISPQELMELLGFTEKMLKLP